MSLADMSPYHMTADDIERLVDETGWDNVKRVIEDLLDLHRDTWVGQNAHAAKQARAMARKIALRDSVERLRPTHSYKFRLLNWRLYEGADDEDVPAENREREMKFNTHTGYGGVSIFSAEPFGKTEVHVELDDRGLHLLIYSPKQDEPLLNGYIKSDHVEIENAGTGPHNRERNDGIRSKVLRTG